MATKVKIRSISDSNKCDSIIDCLTRFKVQFSKILLTDAGFYIVFCNSNNDADMLLSRECNNALRNLDCTPSIPPELAAKKCLIVKSVDQSLVQRSDSEIIEEIESRNTVTVTDFFKFPNSNTIKITFETKEMADKIVNTGLRLFYFSIPTYDIARQTHTPINFCYKCYAIESHNANTCNKIPSYKVCSECSSTEHTFRQCTALQKKCVNCDGAHSTLSYKCPNRKAAERNKVVSTQTRSYASATAGNYAQPPVCNNTSDQLIRANMSITIACMHESTNPGCFQEVLNKLLKNNNLPTYNMGDVPVPQLSLTTSAPVIDVQNNIEQNSHSPTNEGLTSNISATVVSSGPSIAHHTVHPGSTESLQPTTHAATQRHNSAVPQSPASLQPPAPAAPQPPAPAAPQPPAPAARVPHAAGSGENAAVGGLTAGSAVNHTPSCADIQIYKEPGIMGITRRNLKTLVTSGKVLIESKLMAEADCLALLTDPDTPNADTASCFNKALELNQSNFRKKLLERTAKLSKT